MPDRAEPAALRNVALLLRDGDDVAVATEDLAGGGRCGTTTAI